MPAITRNSARIESGPGGAGHTTRSLTQTLEQARRATVNGTRTCTVDECSRRHKARGLCSVHYSAHYRAGADDIDRGQTRSERFWSKVDRSAGLSACWPFLGAVNDQGYGLFYSGRRMIRAHRYAFIAEHAQEPDGVLDHVCHNGSGCAGGPTCPHRRCVNPRHLEDVTPGINAARGQAGQHRHWLGYRASECKRGHAYDVANTRLDRNGYQTCRTCARERQARIRLSNKEN